MKRIVFGIAIVAALISPAAAGDVKEALGYTIALMFDGGCERLPPDYMKAMETGFHKQSVADLDAAYKIASGVAEKVGMKDWCARTKPILLQSISQMN